ncbi:hypothetical protein [Varibaculum vaginae]|uniref:hypothetical protein n=1 Tax=Varibaculum vaginae TaxID=2364797 RepID=UPI000F091FA4|nr:hypothetical protein [Varibaculum vaginae]
MAKKKVINSLLTGALAATVGLCSLAAPGAAFAGDPETGGGTGALDGKGGDASAYVLVAGDNYARREDPMQGWGQASTNYWVDQIAGRLGGSMNRADVQKYADTACNTAMSKAIARSNGQAKKARVVGLYMTLGKAGGQWISWNVAGSLFVDRWDPTWNKANAWNKFTGYTSKYLNKVYDAGLTEAKRVAAASPLGARSVCIALNEFEPEGYKLKVATAAQGAPGVAGGTQGLYDQVRTTAEGSGPVEDLKASLVLNWDGFYGGKPKSVTKTMDIKSVGTANSPTFTPKDFGWNSWAAGNTLR